jgi:coronin-7
MEFFQDDLFPPIRDTRSPLLNVDEWISGQTKEPSLLSLQPQGMKPLSEAPQDTKAKKYDFNAERAKEDGRLTKEKVFYF